MRDGLDAPTLEPSPEDVEAMRAFLDGQSRIKLAVWVRHEHETPDGPSHDHHVALAVDDEDWATGDMPALDAGLRFPRPHDVWNGEIEIEDDTNLCVACDVERALPPGPLNAVLAAAHEAGIAHDGGSLEHPRETPPYATVLYERDAGS